MNLHVFSILCFTYGTLLVGILAYIKRRDPAALRFLLFCLAVSGWGGLTAFWMADKYDAATVILLVRLCDLFATWIAITWIHFLLVFLG